jgi:hypothetical protein
MREKLVVGPSLPRPTGRQHLADREAPVPGCWRLCALAIWVYRQRGGVPWLNRGKMGRMQAASGKGLCGRSARLAGRV